MQRILGTTTAADPPTRRPVFERRARRGAGRGAEARSCARCWSRRTSRSTSPTLVRAHHSPRSKFAPGGPTALPPTSTSRRYVTYGSSPRGGQALLLGAKVLALLDGRVNVTYDDIDRVAVPALNHRLVLNFAARADGVDPRALDRTAARCRQATPPLTSAPLRLDRLRSPARPPSCASSTACASPRRTASARAPATTPMPRGCAGERPRARRPQAVRARRRSAPPRLERLRRASTSASIKTFRAEREAPLHLLLDASASMGVPERRRQARVRRRHSAPSLAYVALRHGNPGPRSSSSAATTAPRLSPLLRHVQRLPELHHVPRAADRAAARPASPTASTPTCARRVCPARRSCCRTSSSSRRSTSRRSMQLRGARLRRRRAARHRPARARPGGTAAPRPPARRRDRHRAQRRAHRRACASATPRRVERASRPAARLVRRPRHRLRRRRHRRRARRACTADRSAARRAAAVMHAASPTHSPGCSPASSRS